MVLSQSTLDQLQDSGLLHGSHISRVLRISYQGLVSFDLSVHAAAPGHKSKAEDVLGETGKTCKAHSLGRVVWIEIFKINRTGTLVWLWSTVSEWA